MAAYAALVSLMHIIDQIQNHPRPPISLEKSQVECLTEKVTFLHDFLECYSNGGGNKEADDLESRIRDAAYAAEDIIESHVVDQLHVGSTIHTEKLNAVDLYQSLCKVIEDMDFIKKEVMLIKEKMGVQGHLHRISVSTRSLRSPSTAQSTVMGFDDMLYDIMDKLTGGQPDRQSISIVGMGGSGKTTLARSVYENQVVTQHFHFLAWATISQDYSMREILLEILLCLKIKSRESLSQTSEDELGEILYKSLSWRSYLILLDDIWNIEMWDKLKFYFPDNNNGSRVLLTTRLSKLAYQLSDSFVLKMNFLDQDTSWNLFCKTVFREEDCPLELNKIGKKIAKNCKGLPLSIVVIGGLLAKSEHTLEYWEHIAENLNSFVSLEDDERCLKVLHMSYNELPIHLKSCFLYMGVFPEDCEIRVSKLIKLLVAEGFLKSVGGKSMEVVMEEYLMDLIDRNLILVRKRKSNGRVKSCLLHDLLRDLCVREAKRQKFFCAITKHSLDVSEGIDTKRRIGIHLNASSKEHRPQVLHALQNASLARSLIWDFAGVLPSDNFRLLRVFSTGDIYSYPLEKDIDYPEGTYYEGSSESNFEAVNLRCLAVSVSWMLKFVLPSSLYRCWNLQILIVRGTKVAAPSEIWKKYQLRHVEFDRLILPDPPSGHMDGQECYVLVNLQTLLTVVDFRCDGEMVKRIPNIKKLNLLYRKFEDASEYCLHSLECLLKLESLCCVIFSNDKPSHLRQTITFPHSLKKLSLYGTKLHWEDMRTKIGSLPLLEVLKLGFRSFIGPQWETIEGQFCGLKFLLIEDCDLRYWTTDSTHFPCLEHLVLRGMRSFEEIPSSIGDIPTLQSIQLQDCSDSAINSSKRILEEQEELGNIGLKVEVFQDDHQE